MNPNEPRRPHWTLEMEAAIVMAKARDEDWLLTFGLDRVFKGGTPGLPWLVKEHLERENPAAEQWKQTAAERERRVLALGRLAVALALAWLFTLILLVVELGRLPGQGLVNSWRP